MKNIAKNQETIRSLALSDLLSRLDLSEDTQLPTYKVLYPETLANDRGTQKRHQEIVRKIVNWPKDDDTRVRSTIGLQ